MNPNSDFALSQPARRFLHLSLKLFKSLATHADFILLFLVHLRQRLDSRKLVFVAGDKHEHK